MKRPERRRAAMAATGTAAAILLAFTMLRTPAPDPPARETPEPAPAPAPAPALPPDEPVPAPASAEGLKLHGLLASGAVIAAADGRQRFFAQGREVRPGLRVARIAQDHVVLASAGGEARLGFDGQRAADAATDAAPAPPPADAAEARLRDDAIGYRLGLEPRRTAGRITGYAIRPGANLPLLRRAGLRPGDVLVGVNGQTFDSDEKVLELPREIAGSFTAEFEFERAGRRMRTTLEINPRS